VYIRSHTPLHTTLRDLEAFPEVTLSQCFKQLCHVFHTPHITSRRFWWQFSSVSQQICSLFVVRFLIKNYCDKLKKGVINILLDTTWT